ncbi:MAG TPA: dTDP-4-dehydrorhamnose 3,5-epimerase [Bacilli bacterium]
MNILKTKLQGVLLIEPRVHEDGRGFFMESYRADLFQQAGIAARFVQDNHSLSVEKGVLRGLHYQLAPKAQAKLVRVVRGAIFDVAVDIRRSSPTFGLWESFVLSAENKRQVYIPRGFAHGFCTLEPDTEVIYKVDQYYSPEHDRGILWNDAELGIPWPVADPVLSEKDRNHPPLKLAEINFA